MNPILVGLFVAILLILIIWVFVDVFRIKALNGENNRVNDSYQKAKNILLGNTK